MTTPYASVAIDILEKETDWPKVQGLVLEDYGLTHHHRYNKIAYFMCRIKNIKAFKQTLGKCLTGKLPGFTFGDVFFKDNRLTRLPPLINIGLTAPGLIKLFGEEDDVSAQVFEAYLKSTFLAYYEGAHARAELQLGDIMKLWNKSFVPDGEKQIHIVLSVYYCGGKGQTDILPTPETERELDVLFKPLKKGLKFLKINYNKNKMRGPHNGMYTNELDIRKEHFGFKDSISQPWINGAPRPKFSTKHDKVMPWTLLLRDEYKAMYSLDAGQCDTAAYLGLPHLGNKSKQHINARIRQVMENGSFGAFRILEKDVPLFRKYLKMASSLSGKTPSWIASRMIGRWYNGTPIAISPDEPNIVYDLIDDYLDPEKRKLLSVNDRKQIEMLNFFPFNSDGLNCPQGSHIRRNNPRNTIIGGRIDLRRLIRRYGHYGSNYDAFQPESAEEKRGLIGFFICTDLFQQFEHVHRQWMNDGRFTALNIAEKDPIYSNNPMFEDMVKNKQPGGMFTVNEEPKNMTFREIPRFVTPRAGVYVFFPSREGLKALAGI